MNICFAYAHYESPKFGGGLATYLQTIIPSLIKAGHKVWVISEYDQATPQNIGGEVYCPVRLGSFHDILQRIFPFFNLPRIVYCLTRQFALADKVRKLDRLYSFHIVEYSNNFADGLMHPLFSKVPFVVKVHSPYEKVFLIKAMEKRCAQLANLVLAPSRFAVRWAEENYMISKEKVIYTPNPFDPERIHGNGTPQDPLNIIFVGWLTRRKGIPVLAKAMRQVFKSVPKAHLIVAGEEPPNTRPLLEDLLKKELKEFGRERINFCGIVQDKEQLGKLYAASSVCVIPSLEETFSYACAEAMALGLPVIASRVGGLPELVKHGENGYLVDADDPESLAGAISALLQNPDQIDRMAKNSKIQIAKFFSLEQATEKTVEAYKLAGKKR